MNATQMSCRLFAKKGEAAPAGIAVRDPRGKSQSASGPSSLSFLIQRRGDKEKASEVALPSSTEDLVKAFPVSDRRDEEYPVQPCLLVELDEAQRDHGGQTPEWKRLSFRMRPEDHRQMRNLARLWGVSVQSLLQKAVKSFVEGAVTPDDAEWRH